MPEMHGTTVVVVRNENSVAMGSDGQITMGTDILCNATFEITLFADGFEDGTTDAWN